MLIIKYLNSEDLHFGEHHTSCYMLHHQLLPCCCSAATFSLRPLRRLLTNINTTVKLAWHCCNLNHDAISYWTPTDFVSENLNSNKDESTNRTDNIQRKYPTFVVKNGCLQRKHPTFVVKNGYLEAVSYE